MKQSVSVMLAGMMLVQAPLAFAQNQNAGAALPVINATPAGAGSTIIFGPSGQLNQVFMNILNNAQQAISGRGEITISTAIDDEWTTVSFRDTGPGIPDEIITKIFDPFFTTKDPGIGTGLGLSLSYGIISKLGGSIQCRSVGGEGTEFVARFPTNCKLTSDAQPQSAATPVLTMAAGGFPNETGCVVR